MENPNEYDDDGFTKGTNDLENAIAGLWESGAALDNIEDIISNALENATGHAILVSLDGDGRFASA
jgi:hypothetical protein